MDMQIKLVVVVVVVVVVVEGVSALSGMNLEKM